MQSLTVARIKEQRFKQIEIKSLEAVIRVLKISKKAMREAREAATVTVDNETKIDNDKFGEALLSMTMQVFDEKSETWILTNQELIDQLPIDCFQEIMKAVMEFNNLSEGATLEAEKSFRTGDGEPKPVS